MKKYLGLALVLLLTGCSPVKPSDLIKHSYLKNYAIGQVQTAYVGQPVVKARDFYEDRLVTYLMMPTKDFVLKGTYSKEGIDYPVRIVGKKDAKYPCSASMILQGREYFVVTLINADSDSGESVGMLVDNEGKIYPDIVFDADNYLKMTLVSAEKKGEDARLVRDPIASLVEEKDLKLFACYTNFEVLYGGINKVSMNLTYREFTIENMARPSFFQNLVYEPNAKGIRFKDVVIDVIQATNEKIVYVVKGDGLTERTYNQDNAPDDYLKCRAHYERLNTLRRLPGY